MSPPRPRWNLGDLVERYPLAWLAFLICAALLLLVSCSRSKTPPTNATTNNPAEAMRDELRAGKKTIDETKALKEQHHAQAAEDEKSVAAITAPRPAAATAPAPTPIDVRAWYAQLQEKRKNLDLKDAAAVSAFNRETERYHDAVASQPRKQTAEPLKPLDNKLPALPDQLRPLDNSLKPLPGSR